MIDALELLGLTPRPKLAGTARVRTVEGEERVRYKRKPQKITLTKEQRRERDARYFAKNAERISAQRRAAGRRYYWKNAEALRARTRERMRGKQVKVNYTPEQWRRRLEMAKAAKLRREANDPAAREIRLAKGREYWRKKQAQKRGEA